MVKNDRVQSLSLNPSMFVWVSEERGYGEERQQASSTERVGIGEKDSGAD